MNLFITGDTQDQYALAQVCKEAGHTGNPDLPVDAVFDMHLTDINTKREFVAHVATDLIFTAAAPCSATQAASWAIKPSRVVGISPIYNGLIEIAPALQTAPETLERAEEFLRSLNLEVVPVADGPGLVRLRVLSCLINEAASALMERVASAEDIDLGMKLGANYPRGLLEWADEIGVDVVLAVMRGLQAEYGEDRYRPSPLLIRQAQARQKFYGS
jgi:3-hydroxybutyryl-CoA dehydrogenase